MKNFLGSVGIYVVCQTKKFTCRLKLANKWDVFTEHQLENWLIWPWWYTYALIILQAILDHLFASNDF